MTKFKVISPELFTGNLSKTDEVFLPVTVDPRCSSTMDVDCHWDVEDGRQYDHCHNHFGQQQSSSNCEDQEVFVGNGPDPDAENAKDEGVGLSTAMVYAVITGTPDFRDWRYRASVTSAAVIVAIVVFLVFGHRHACSVLRWLEQADPVVSVLVLATMFIVVCFPMFWGLSLLTITAGYLYGLLYGPLLATISATAGLAISTPMMRVMCSGHLQSFFYSDQMNAIVRVVSGPHGMKIVALTRLTPIPFGLQNAVFSVSEISLLPYLIYSGGGLIPMTVLNCYMGSTLRSIQDMMYVGSLSLTGHLVFGGQILVTVILLWFMVRKARVELKKAMDEIEKLPFAFPNDNCSKTVLQDGL